MCKLLKNTTAFLKIISGFGSSEPEKFIAEILIKKHLRLAVAESCTGGLISSMLTDISGSSDFTEANFITYSNQAKHKYLGVSEDTLKHFGALSPETAKEMADGLIKQTGADYSVAITGIAGPTGGTADKPVGTVFIGVAGKISVKVTKFNADPDLNRKIIKHVFAKQALQELYLFIKQNEGLK